MSRWKQWAFTGIGMVMLLFYMPAQIFAAGQIEMEEEVYLKIESKNENGALSDVEFSIFQIASLDDKGGITVTDSFHEFPVVIEGESEGAWRNLALTLEAYALRDHIQPMDQDVTDEFGEAFFPSGDQSLKKGLYLVTASKHIKENTVFEFSPFIISLPAMDYENNEWIYNVTVESKFEERKIPELTTCKVMKIWKDDGKEEERPKEIEVLLLKNGQIFETVMLNKQNNWQYVWERLDGTAHWTVAEKEIEGYRVEITKEGSSYIITNTCEEEEDETEPKLPQTGQMWWPVPLLTAAGLLSILVGLVRKGQEK